MLMKKSNANKSTMFAAIVLATAALFCVVILVIRSLLYHGVMDEVTNITRQSAMLVDERVNCAFLDLDEYAYAISKMNIYDTDEICEYLKKCNETKNYVRLGYLDSEGYGYSTMGELGNLQGRGWVDEVLNGNRYVSGVWEDRFDHNEKSIAFAVPLNRNGRTVGAVYLVQRTEKLNSWFVQPIYDGQGFTFIVQGDNKIAFHPNKDFDGDGAGKSGMNPIIYERVLNMFESGSYGATHIRENKFGLNRYIGFCELKNVPGWKVVSSIDAVSITRSVNRVIAWLCIIFAIFEIALVYVIIKVLYAKKQREEETRKYAFTDELTGINNAGMFYMRLQSVLKSIRKSKFGILYFDIDNFKMINDINGYHSGDEVLLHIAKTLKKLLNNGELYARLFNDCFIVLKEIENEDTLPELFRQLEEEISHIESSTSLKIVLSGGIYYIKDKDVNIYQVINRANIARSTVKADKQNRLAVYNERLHEMMTDSTIIENDIRQGIDEDQFEVYYQPKVDLKTEKICGAEALIRWNHPQKGFLTPGQFIPNAEKSGLIVPLGRWCFEHVCQNIAELSEHNKKKMFPISVNFSKMELYQPDTIEFIQSIMRKYNIKGGLVEIEITETSELNNMDYTIGLIRRIKSMGIRVSLDDFGTGYSSLSYLKSIPVNVLKLDKSFVDNLEISTVNKNIINAVVALGKSLELEIVSEGVETQSQLNYIRECGADMVQGFYFYKPMPFSEFKEKLLNE